MLSLYQKYISMLLGHSQYKGNHFTMTVFNSMQCIHIWQDLFILPITKMSLIESRSVSFQINALKIIKIYHTHARSQLLVGGVRDSYFWGACTLSQPSSNTQPHPWKDQIHFVQMDLSLLTAVNLAHCQNQQLTLSGVTV